MLGEIIAWVLIDLLGDALAGLFRRVRGKRGRR